MALYTPSTFTWRVFCSVSKKLNAVRRRVARLPLERRGDTCAPDSGAGSAELNCRFSRHGQIYTLSYICPTTKLVECLVFLTELNSVKLLVFLWFVGIFVIDKRNDNYPEDN